MLQKGVSEFGGRSLVQEDSLIKALDDLLKLRKQESKRT
jgi:hypothetical protein